MFTVVEHWQIKRFLGRNTHAEHNETIAFTSILTVLLAACTETTSYKTAKKHDKQHSFRYMRHVSCKMIKPVKFYIRFWEYSNGVDSFPDWCIILVHCNFAKKQEQELQELVRFFKEYVPRYGYKHIGIENNQKLNEVLMLPQMRSTKEDNHVIALTDITI